MMFEPRVRQDREIDGLIEEIEKRRAAEVGGDEIARILDIGLRRRFRRFGEVPRIRRITARGGNQIVFEAVRKPREYFRF